MIAEIAVPAVSGISDVLWYAIIITISTTASPLILSYFTNRHVHRDRVEDWARQDAVAKKAADAAELLLASNQRMAARTTETAALLVDSNEKMAAKAASAAALLVSSNEKMAAKTAETATLLLADTKKVVATAAAATNQKLDVIHTLVNSNLTASMQSELDAFKAQLVLMNEVSTLNTAAGRPPNAETITMRKAVEKKIATLAASLQDRLTAQAAIDADLAKGR